MTDTLNNHVFRYLSLSNCSRLQFSARQRSNRRLSNRLLLRVVLQNFGLQSRRGNAEVMSLRVHVWRANRPSDHPKGRSMSRKPSIRTGKKQGIPTQHILKMYISHDTNIGPNQNGAAKKTAAASDIEIIRNSKVQGTNEKIEASLKKLIVLSLCKIFEIQVCQQQSTHIQYVNKGR